MRDSILDGLLTPDDEANRWLLGALLAAMLICGVVILGELAPDPFPPGLVDDGDRHGEE